MNWLCGFESPCFYYFNVYSRFRVLETFGEAFLSCWMLLVSYDMLVPVTLPTWRVKSSHTPPVFPGVRTWPLRNKDKKGGLWTWNNSPTLKCKTLLPQHGTGPLPPLICRKWLEFETMSLTPSSQPLKLAQHAVSGQSGRESRLNRDQAAESRSLFVSITASNYSAVRI